MLKRFLAITKPHPAYPGAIIGVTIGSHSEYLLQVSHLHSRALCAILCGVLLSLLTWYALPSASSVHEC